MAIDIGEGAKSRSAGFPAGYTIINEGNPANASGTITSVELWANLALDGCKVGIFYKTNGDMLKCRSVATIGHVISGQKKTSPLDPAIAVEAGDYIGIYYSSGEIEEDASGYGGIWYENSDNCVINDETVYTHYAGAAVSLYGTGEEVGAYYHGLKVQGEGELALCDAGSNPLRIRKGGVTYGIELVDTADGNASAIRIKTGAGTKAIRRYT